MTDDRNVIIRLFPIGEDAFDVCRSPHNRPFFNRAPTPEPGGDTEDEPLTSLIVRTDQQPKIESDGWILGSDSEQ